MPQRILIRGTNWVGDAVMSLPALHAVRAAYPRAHMAVLARPWVADLYRREPFCDEVIAYDAPSGWRGVRAKVKVASELRARRFDLAILLQNAFEAAALVWLARIPRRIGYDRDGRGFLLTDAIPLPATGGPTRHQRFYYLELLRRAGIIGAYSPDAVPELVCATEARSAGQRRLTALGIAPAIGVSPGAAYGSAKRWPAERFAETAARLARETGSHIALFGSRAERPLCEQIGALLRRDGLHPVNFAGNTSLAEFVDLVAGCELMLTNDSGAMHIAYALRVPTVAVFGSTDQLATGPVGPHTRVVREPVSCSPCLLRECPIDHRCMTRIDAARVSAAAHQLLQLSALQ